MIAFNAIHAEITWTLSDDGTLTISGTDMPDYQGYYDYDLDGYYSYAPWTSQREEIKKIVIEDGVTSIGVGAFASCSCLTSITIPNSVTSIGDAAFMVCSGLTSITIPNSVTSIGWQAFVGCSNLTFITIPNSVTSIGDGAFNGCSGLTSITIPNSVTSIGSTAFLGCSGLTSITIPNSVTSIGNGAFNGCSGLISIIVEEGNSKYDSRNNCNAIIETESNTLIRGCKNTVIPNSVTSIGPSAFSGCSSLTSITIPNSVTSIESSAFNSCSGLTSISIPISVTNIGYMAFYRCSSLSSVTISNSVTNIGDYAFSGCSGLTSITCEANTPPNCGYHCFDDIDKSIPIYVPANSFEVYKVANGWKDFTNIQAIPTTYTLTDGELYNIGSQREGCDISYTRTFNNDKWQALYIPFSLNYNDWKDDFDIAYINGVRQIDTNDDNVIDETIMDVYRIEEGSLIPNTPYLIRAKTTGEKTISISNATLYEAVENSIDCSTTIVKYTFTGTYNTIPASTLIENEYYAMGGGSVIMTDGESDLKPFRWYLKIEARNPIYNVANIPNAAKNITIKVLGEEGEATGITQMSHNDKTISRIYDLNGRAVNENPLKSGMYIQNGKKLVIK